MTDANGGEQIVTDNQQSNLDEISELFFGKIKSIKSYTAQDGSTQFLSEKDDIFLNVLLKFSQEIEIYSAWNKDNCEYIENFQVTPD